MTESNKESDTNKVTSNLESEGLASVYQKFKSSKLFESKAAELQIYNKKGGKKVFNQKIVSKTN